MIFRAKKNRGCVAVNVPARCLSRLHASPGRRFFVSMNVSFVVITSVSSFDIMFFFSMIPYDGPWGRSPLNNKKKVRHVKMYLTSNFNFKLREKDAK